MQRTFNASLSSKSVRQLQKELEEYRIKTLPSLLRRFTEALAEVGITVAKGSIRNEWKGMITFSKRTVATDGSVSTIMVATETRNILSAWLYYGNVKTAIVSPLLMSEFGSGIHAVAPMTLDDGTQVGRGTFPEQTHADKPYWYYQDLNGMWQIANGISPTYPMHNAVMEMIGVSERIARTIFG